MRIAHLSDLHAGYSAYQVKNDQDINIREADGYIALEALISDVIDTGVDCVVIAGDTFHSPNPSIRTIVFVQNQFRRLWSAGIPVYALAGNHDTNDIAADIASSRVVHDPWRNIYSHIEPYMKHEIGDGVWLHMVSHHMYSEQEKTMLEVKPVPNAVNIFTTHGSVIDPILEMKLHAEQSPREIVIPDFLVQDYNWDYIMLGHIHERGWVGSKDGSNDDNNLKMFYNGSVIRRGFSDGRTPLGRGWTLWTIDPEGKFTPEFHEVAQRPQYDFAPLNTAGMTPTEITDSIVENIRATRTDNDTKDNAPILRQTLNNMTLAKYSSLDMKAIDAAAAHALDWKMKVKYVTNPSMVQNTEGLDGESELRDNSNMVDLYDKWVEKSTIFDDMKDTTKEKVLSSARDFVKLGQEATFDEE